MADNTKPQIEGSGSHAIADAERARLKRREFVRKAATIGLPVVLASVSNRTTWVHAQTTPGGTVATSPGHASHAP